MPSVSYTTSKGRILVVIVSITLFSSLIQVQRQVSTLGPLVDFGPQENAIVRRVAVAGMKFPPGPAGGRHVVTGFDGPAAGRGASRPRRARNLLRLPGPGVY